MRGWTMRKVLSGGVLLSLGLFAAHAAVEAWVEARAVLELERMAAGLPEGARLTWTRLDARPLHLALDLEGLRLDLPSGGTVRSLELGTLRLAQAGGGVDSLGRVGAVVGGELVVRLADDRGTLRAAQVEGDSVDIQALETALAAPDPMAALEALRLGPVRAREVTLDGQGSRLQLQSLAVQGYAERRLQGLALDGLELSGPGGEEIRLRAFSLGLLDLAALDEALAAADDPVALLAGLDRLRLDAVRLADLELRWPEGGLRLEGFGLERAGQGRVESFALDGLQAFEGDDLRVGLGHLSLALLDWSRVRLDRLVDAGARLVAVARALEEEEEDVDDPSSEEEPGSTAEAEGRVEADGEPAADDLATSFASLELAGEIVRLRIGPIRLERLDGGTPEGGVSLARFAFEGLEAGRLGALELAGVAARGEEGWTARLGRYEQSALTVGPVDLAERVERAPRTSEGLQELLAELARQSWQGRFVLAGWALEREGRLGFGIERLALAFEEDGPRKRTTVALDDLVLDPVALGVDDAAAGLDAMSTDRLALRGRLATVYDQSSQDVAIEDLTIDAPGQAAVGFTLAARLGADPAIDPVTASTDAALVRAELVLRDQGAVERWLARSEKERRRKRADLAKELVRELRREEPGRSLLDQRRAGEIEKFLARPRTLVIRLAPPKPVGFLAVFMGMMASPAQAARTLGLAIEARDR